MFFLLVKLGMEVLVEELMTTLNMLVASRSLLQVQAQVDNGNSEEASYDSLNLTEQMRECMESWLELSREVLGNSEVAVVVLDDLLNYDKIEMGTMRLEFELVRIWELIKSVESHFRLNAKAKNVELQLKVQQHMLVRSCSVDAAEGTVDDKIEDTAALNDLIVWGDINRLAQVLRNLVSNGLKFTPENGKVTMAGKEFSLKIVVLLNTSGIIISIRFTSCHALSLYNHRGASKGLPTWWACQ